MGTTKTKAAADAASDEEPRTVVWLGNRDAIEVLVDPDDDFEAAADEGRALRQIRRKVDTDRPVKRCTTVVLAPGLKLMEAAYDLTHGTKGVWQAHSDAEAPAWVASTDPTLAQVLAQHWGCELREPDPDHEASDPYYRSTADDERAEVG